MKTENTTLTEDVLFSSKHVLKIFYYGAYIALVLYAIKFMQQVLGLTIHFWDMSIEQMMLEVLLITDGMMVGNLIKQQIVGSYQSFVSKVYDGSSEHISSGMLKVKLSTSLVGISSIYLLHLFLDPIYTPLYIIYKAGGLHVLFLFSSLVLSVNEYLHLKGESLSQNH